MVKVTTCLTFYLCIYQPNSQGKQGNGVLKESMQKEEEFNKEDSRSLSQTEQSITLHEHTQG